jgi:hypothetical protein
LRRKWKKKKNWRKSKKILKIDTAWIYSEAEATASNSGGSTVEVETNVVDIEKKVEEKEKVEIKKILKN